MNTCPHCGGAIMPRNLPYAYAGKVCMCHYNQSPFPMKPFVPLGWQCPVCKAVHAPSVKTCPEDHS